MGEQYWTGSQRYWTGGGGGSGLNLLGSGEVQVVDAYEPSDSRQAENGLAIDNLSVPQGNCSTDLVNLPHCKSQFLKHYNCTNRYKQSYKVTKIQINQLKNKISIFT